MADELLSCPFCGGAAEVREWDFPYVRFQARCVECKTTGRTRFNERAKAIAAWNHRTPPTPATDAREAVAQWCSGCHEVRSVDCYRAGCPKSDTEEREAVARATDLEVLVMEIGVDVAELPDRTSPDDQPDMMLVNFEELQIILSNRIAPFVAAEILAAEANERARIEADLKDPQIVHMNMLRGGIAKINVTQAMHLNGWTSIDNWHRMTVEQIEAAVKARNEHGAGK